MDSNLLVFIDFHAPLGLQSSVIALFSELLSSHLNRSQAGQMHVCIIITLSTCLVFLSWFPIQPLRSDLLPSSNA